MFAEHLSQMHGHDRQTRNYVERVHEEEAADGSVGECGFLLGRACLLGVGKKSFWIPCQVERDGCGEALGDVLGFL